jgi:4-amino-4-deoxy-L-arabinose transferase-like glycosyltransferase
VVAGAALTPARYRLALVALLAGTALLYLWRLGDSGWANTYYSAAAQAASQSWKALLLGCSDAACASTIDKPPLALWPMALSVAVAGLSSWSVLVPQAVIGVLTVGVLVATVRRSTASYGAALVAGLVLALTPVATLMFRFNNPDALLTLLTVLAAACVLRAVETGARHPVRWVLLAGVVVGAAFLVKMLQAFLVLPALGLVYLVAAAAPFWRRVGHLLLGFAATLGVAGTWVLLVASWPADSRPYIGSTQDNSILELVGGYNGVERLAGGDTTADYGEEAGPLRMLSPEVGGQVGWLLPTAVLVLLLVLWLRRGEPRTDPLRAAVVLWGTWLLVAGAVFSAMAGVFHAYYTVALAPAVAASVGLGWHVLRDHRVFASAVVLVAAVTGVVLMGRSTDFAPAAWLPGLIGAAGGLAVVLLAAGRRAAGALALVAGLAGPAAYAVDTAGTEYRGAVPVAGPTTEGRPVRGPTGQYADNLTGVLDTPALDGLLRATDTRWAAAVLRANPAGGFQLASGRPVIAVGGFGSSDPFPAVGQFARWVRQGQVRYYVRVEPDTGPILGWVQAQGYEPTTVDGFEVYDLFDRPGPGSP